MRIKKEVILWAESQAEVESFLELLEDKAEFNFTDIYVAKKSKGKRDVGHQYLAGTYFPYDQTLGATLNDPIQAPDYVTSLVQWCSPDLIITNHAEALITIETTYHELAFNNVAQRIPRQIRSATLGVPSVIFQKLGDNFESQSFVTWYAQTFVKATKIYKTPCLALTFPENDFEKARSQLVDLTNSRINNSARFIKISQDIFEQMLNLSSGYDENILINGTRGTGRTWLNVDEDNVEVIIGVRDNCALSGIPNYGCQGNDQQKTAFRRQLKTRDLGAPGCVWLSKGTGGMDPYPGLVKMAEILLCYDDEGNKVKSIASKFSNLPKNFWWFERNQNEIYYKLVNEFSEDVIYSETYR